VSEQILNGTSAQSGYSRWYTLENMDRRQNKKQTLLKLSTTQKKQTTQNTTNKTILVYDTQPGNDVGLFYNAPSPHGARTVGALHRRSVQLCWILSDPAQPTIPINIIWHTGG